MRNYKRVLVTGGAGFIGANYVQAAVKNHPEWEIIVLDKLTYAGNLENLEGVKDKITFVHGDIADPDIVEQAMKGADAVVNFAAESHVDRSLQDARPFVKTNVEGTLVLLDAAKRFEVGRFLHVSTDEVYGDVSSLDGHSHETHNLAPRSPYAASKAAAEHMVMSYGISFDMDVVITRGSNTYGPYQYPEKIIPLFITNAMQDLPVPVYGDGSAIRDYMHAADHASGIDTVLHAGVSGEAYNLGAREQINGQVVAHEVLRLLGKPESLIKHVQDRPGHDYRYSVDPSRVESLGWERQYSFEQGLAKTVSWFQQNETWWRAVRAKKAHQDLMGTWYEKRWGSEMELAPAFEEPNLSVVVVAHNSGDVLGESLERLTALYPQAEVVLVDSGSNDGSCAKAKKKFPAINVLTLENRGYAHAVNKGVEHSSKPKIVQMNADVLLASGDLEAIVQPIFQNISTAFCGPVLVSRSGKRQSFGVFYEPNFWNIKAPTGKKVGWISGAISAFSRETFEKIGGMDERFFFYNEDLEWCLRARKFGLSSVLVPRKVVHIGGHSTPAEGRMLAEGYRGGLLISKMYYPALHSLHKKAVWLEAKLKQSLDINAEAYGRIQKMLEEETLETSQFVSTQIKQ